MILDKSVCFDSLSSGHLTTFSSHPAVDPIRLTKAQLKNPSVVETLSDYTREHVEDFRLHRWIGKLVGNDGIRFRLCGIFCFHLLSFCHGATSGESDGIPMI